MNVEESVAFGGGSCGCSGGGLMAAGAEGADYAGEQGEEHYDDDDVMDAVTKIGHEFADAVPAEDHAAYPEDAAKNVVGEVLRVIHSRGACHRRTEGAHDGNVAREDDGLAAVCFVEIVGAFEMGALEEERVRAIVNRAAGPASNGVAELVTGNGAEDGKGKQGPKIQEPRGGKDSGSDEKGIAGEKESNEEASFNEDDNANGQYTAPVD